MHLLRVSEFAERIGVHRVTVQRWLSKDLIPFVRLPSGERRVSSEVVDSLLHSRSESQFNNDGDLGGI
jgi:excisionase family DNA binding protein